MNVHADLSKALFYDLAFHWRRDLDRMQDDKGIRPAKTAAYMAFWIRKTKPISNAYALATIQAYKNKIIPFTEEITNINEKVATRLAFQIIAQCAEKGFLKIHDSQTNQDIPLVYNRKKYEEAVSGYCNQKLGLDGKSVLEVLIYDMRYRAFGPHNLVHIFDQFVFSLTHKLERGAPQPKSDSTTA